MPQAAVASHIHQTLDVHRLLTPQIAFDAIFAVDQFADAHDFIIGQLIHAALGRDAQLLADDLRVLRANAKDVAKRDQDSLISRNIHAGDARHSVSPGAEPPDTAAVALGAQPAECSE